jgi:hypothetical protein
MSKPYDRTAGATLIGVNLAICILVLLTSIAVRMPAIVTGSNS